MAIGWSHSDPDPLMLVVPIFGENILQRWHHCFHWKVTPCHERLVPLRQATGQL